jgi:enoyl-CoA hydratase
VTRIGRIRMSVENGIGWIVIDNPSLRNALSAQMMVALAEAVGELELNPLVAATVIRGAGDDAFCAGADLGEVELRSQPLPGGGDWDSSMDRVFTRLAATVKPVIAMIHGYCFGAGVAVALASDVRFGDDRSTLAIPAAKMGIGYPLELSKSLVAAVGPANAAEILFAGDRVEAQDALRIGLLNRVLPAGELEAAVETFAGAIVANAPLSVRAAKLSIRASQMPSAEEEARAAIHAASSSDDAREGPTAFREKRSPKFVGH